MEIEIETSKAKGKHYQVKTSLGDKLKMSEETVFRYGVFEGATFSKENWLEVMRADE